MGGRLSRAFTGRGEGTESVPESKPLSDLGGNTQDNDVDKTILSHQNTVSEALVPQVYIRRWVMLGLFCAYSFSNAFQWIHLNIIGNLIHRYYNESLPGNSYRQQVAIDWLSMIYMLAYIPLIFPATWLLNRKGLRIVAIVGTLLNALGAWLKCASVSPDRFAVLMLAQTLCAIAQIFILGIPPRLSAVWFGPDEVSTATSMGVFGNQVGVAIGFLVPPELVPDSDNLDEVGHGLSIMFYGTAAVTTLLFILVIAIFKDNPPTPPSQAQVKIVEAAAHENYQRSLSNLFRNRGYILLVISYGINTGSYYAISTLLNPIVLEHFPTELVNVGRIGLTLVIAGVLGSVLAGIWLDKTRKFKYTTFGIYLLSLAGTIAFTFTLKVGQIWVVFLCAGALGFFMTGYLPVGFEFAAEITYPESEGTSAGMLNASAQTFGIIMTISMGLLLNSYGTLAANLSVCAILLIGTVLTALIKEDLRRQKAGKEIIQNEIMVNGEEKTKLDIGPV